MKIATNVQRDAFGGITISNLALFDWLADKDDLIVGIECVTGRHFAGPNIFRHYEPSFFSHHIISCIDIFSRYPWGSAHRIEKNWAILIETTKDILREESPDVVLVNGTYFASWILAQAARSLNIPIALRYAGVMQREISHLGYFARRRFLTYERWIVNSAQSIIFPSTLCKTVVENDVMQRKIDDGVVIPNPVQEVAPVFRASGRRSRYTIAAIGRWSRIKNFQSFVALHEKLIADKWPHRAIMITSRIDKSFIIPETIERRPSMSQEALRAFYRSIDLLVVPSHFETFCNVAAEAVMFGASVLVSENVGFAEVLKRAGLKRMVIPSFDDPKVVAAAVRRLAKTRLTKKEWQAVYRIVNPQDVHEALVDVLTQTFSVEKT